MSPFESLIVLPQLSDSSAAELVGVLLDEVGQLEEQPAAIGGVHRAPGAGLQRPRAALTARSTSAAVPAATFAITSPVAGLYVSNSPPSAGSTHSLLISKRVWRMAGEENRAATVCAMDRYLIVSVRVRKDKGIVRYVMNNVNPSRRGRPG